MSAISWAWIPGHSENRAQFRSRPDPIPYPVGSCKRRAGGGPKRRLAGDKSWFNRRLSPAPAAFLEPADLAGPRGFPCGARWKRIITHRENKTMGNCAHHPDRETRFQHQTHGTFFRLDCLQCRDLEIYCKFSASGPIAVMEKTDETWRGKTSPPDRSGIGLVSIPSPNDNAGPASPAWGWPPIWGRIWQRLAIH